MTHEEIGKRLVTVRKYRKLTQAQLGEKMGITKSTISRYESGSIDDIRIPIIQSFAKYLNVSPGYLLGYTDEMTSYAKYESPDMSDVTPVPILSEVRAGQPMYAESNFSGFVYADLPVGNYFALKVVGDSMSASGIVENDIVICREQIEVEDNDIAVVLIDKEEATIKRVTRKGSSVILTPQSFNPVHTPLIYDLAKTDVRILGKVVFVQHQVK